MICPTLPSPAAQTNTDKLCVMVMSFACACPESDFFQGREASSKLILNGTGTMFHGAEMQSEAGLAGMKRCTAAQMEAAGTHLTRTTEVR